MPSSREGRRHTPGHREQLFESENGRVRYCQNCASFELRFGNVILGLTPEDLATLADTIASFDVDREALLPEREHTVIWVGNSGTGLRFSREEVAELNRLLAGAMLLASLHGPVS